MHRDFVLSIATICLYDTLPFRHFHMVQLLEKFLESYQIFRCPQCIHGNGIADNGTTKHQFAIPLRNILAAKPRAKNWPLLLPSILPPLELFWTQEIFSTTPEAWKSYKSPQYNQ